MVNVKWTKTRTQTSYFLSIAFTMFVSANKRACVWCYILVRYVVSLFRRTQQTSEPKANDKYNNLNILRQLFVFALFTQCYICFMYSTRYSVVWDRRVRPTNRSTNQPTNQITEVENNRNEYHCNTSNAIHTHIILHIYKTGTKQISMVFYFVGNFSYYNRTPIALLFIKW